MNLRAKEIKMEPRDWVQMGTVVIGFAFTIGVASARFDTLEKKFDKLDDRVWEMQARKAVSDVSLHPLPPCVQDNTRVALSLFDL